MNTTELLPLTSDGPTDGPTDALTPVEEIPSGLPRADGVAIWGAFQSDIERLKATSATITIRDAKDTHGMKLARDMRLAFRTLRLSIDSKADELKADAQREVKRIEKSARDLRKLCEEQEAALAEKEQFAILEAARLEDDLRTARHAELAPWLPPGMSPAVDLGKIGEELWVEMRDRCRTAFEGEQERKRIEEEKRLEADRKRREEEERVRAENARLKKEAEEREAAAKEEREAAEAEQRRLKAEAEERERTAAEEREKIAAERAQERAKAEKERAAVEAKAKAEQERQRKEFEAKERAAREAQEAEQKRIVEQQRQKDAAIAEERRLEREKAEKDRLRLETEKQKLETERRQQQEAERQRAEKEAKERAAREEADRIKAAAPDKEKLLAYADAIDELDVPVLPNRDRIMTDLVAARNELTARIRAAAVNLGKTRR